MNIVLVKHNNNPKEFAFYVPEELLPYIKKGREHSRALPIVCLSG